MSERKIMLELVDGMAFQLTDADYLVGVRVDGADRDEIDTAVATPRQFFQLVREGFYDHWRLAAESIAESDFKRVLEAQNEPNWKSEAPDPDELETRRSEILFGNEEIDRMIVIEPRDDG